jgi:prevent-host-death family protein
LIFTTSKFIFRSVNLKVNKMVSTAKKLRFHTKELLETVSRGEEVIITLRGKPYAKLVPYKHSKDAEESENKLFGIWSDNKSTTDVNKYVRKLRKKRT